MTSHLYHIRISKWTLCVCRISFDISFLLTSFQISFWATKVSVPKGICCQSAGRACWWPSSFEWLYWQAEGRLESKAAVLLPLLFNFSFRPLKWYCGTHEPETELIMNSQETPNVQFSQISPWSDFAQVLNPDGGEDICSKVSSFNPAKRWICFFSPLLALAPRFGALTSLSQGISFSAGSAVWFSG